jgi:hypothetical protein
MTFAMAGDTARALELVEQAVEHNPYPHDFIARYTPFMAPLRGMPEFEGFWRRRRGGWRTSGSRFPAGMQWPRVP